MYSFCCPRGLMITIFDNNKQANNCVCTQASGLPHQLNFAPLHPELTWVALAAVPPSLFSPVPSYVSTGGVVR